MTLNWRTRRVRSVASLVLLAGWVLYAPYSCTFMMKDAVAKKEFDSAGVALHIETVYLQKQPLHYALTGGRNKPTIIFIHGSPGSWAAFKDYLKDTALLQRYRLISIDRPGFGKSNFGHALALPLQAGIVSAFMDSLSNGLPVYLVGHSLGGPLAVKLAAMRPDVVHGIVVLAGAMIAAEEKPEIWRKIVLKTPLNLLMPGAFRPSNAELWYLKNDLKALPPDFEKVNCVVYLVHGTKDNMVPYNNMPRAAEMLTHAARVKMMPIENASHFIPWQHYTEIRNVLLQLPQ